MDERLEHERLVMAKVKEEEDREIADVENIRLWMSAFLTEKLGFSPDEIEKDPSFTFKAGDKADTSTADFIVRLNGRRVMAVKCALSSIESRERHMLALCRVAEQDYQMPFAVITDSIDALILDVPSGKRLSESIRDIPSRQALLESNIRFERLPDGRREKEIKILLAFEAVRISQGGCSG